MATGAQRFRAFRNHLGVDFAGTNTAREPRRRPLIMPVILEV